MAGMRDLLTLVLRWWSSGMAAPRAIPPFRVEQAQVFVTGQTSGQNFLSGPTIGQNFIDGAAAGQILI